MPRPAPKPKHTRPQTPPVIETVEVAWLLRAVGIVLAAALVCVYITLCLIFYKKQAREVLHPVRTPTSSSPNLIHFGAVQTGQPQLAGEWMGAPKGSRYSHLTLLFLASGDGNRSTFAATQHALQQIGLNVFAFDYRGYGQSYNLDPTQSSMTEDSDSAWSYLTSTRGVPASSIVPYGVGAGASLAARLAAQHPEIGGLILDSPHTDLEQIIRHDPRLRLLPTGLLFHERFPLIAPLASLNKPKLLLFTGRTRKTPEPAPFASAAAPRITVELPTLPGPLFDQAVRRFLDQPLAVPSPTPFPENPR